MTGYNFHTVGCWRQELKRYIPEEAPIKFFSPLRGERQYLGDFAVIPTGVSNDRDRTVMIRDHWDTVHADAVVVKLTDATRVSIGTVMEIAWAYDRGVPIIFIMDATGCPHDHPMIRAARSFRVDTVKQAAQQLLTLLAISED